jgi:hypothetical protein
VSGTLPSADEVIALSGLTPQAACTLAEHLAERAHGPRVPLHVPYFRDALPLLIQERVRYGLFFGQAPHDGLSLAQLIDARVEALSADARLLLELVCTVHDPLPQEVLERAAGLPRALFSRQLTTLRVGSLVRCFVLAGEDHVAPSHMVVASTFAQRPGTCGPAVHARLSAALASREPARASARLFRFQSESGDVAGCAASARVAAQEAERALAFQRTAELFSIAVARSPDAHDDTGQPLVGRLADALSNAGWSLAAAHSYRKAAALSKPADAIRMRQLAAEHFLRAAEYEVGLTAVRELLASFEVELPKTPRLAFWSLVRRRIYLALRGVGFRELSEGQVPTTDLRRVDALWSAGARLSMVDIMRGGDLLARGLGEALTLGEPSKVARALCTESWTVLGYKRSYIERMSTTIECARALIEKRASPALDGHLKLAEGMAAFARFAITDATARVRDAERVFRDSCRDSAWEITVAQTYQMMGLTQGARFSEASCRYDTWTQEAQERGDIWGYAQLMTLGAVGVKLSRDLPNEAAEDVRAAGARWEDAQELHVQHLFQLVAVSYIDLYRGVNRGLESLEQRWGQFKRQFFLQVRFSRTALFELRGRARLFAAKQRKDAALLRAAEADARVLIRHGEAPERGFGQLLLANACIQRGQLERGVELLRSAIAELEPHGLELWSLSARCMLGRLIGGDTGTAVYREAHGVLAGRGAKNPGRIMGMMLPGCEPP